MNLSAQHVKSNRCTWRFSTIPIHERAGRLLLRICREIGPGTGNASLIAVFSRWALTGLTCASSSVGGTICLWFPGQRPCPANLTQYFVFLRWFPKRWPLDRLALGRTIRVENNFWDYLTFEFSSFSLFISPVCRKFLLEQGVFWWSLFRCPWIAAGADSSQFMREINFLCLLPIHKVSAHDLVCTPLSGEQTSCTKVTSAHLSCLAPLSHTTPRAVSSEQPRVLQ